LPEIVADLLRRQVTVIAAYGPAIAAAKLQTTTIPIVFSVAIDPVAAGFVASLARPGGNPTGVTKLGAEVGPKRLELLVEMVQTAGTVAVLFNPSNPLADALSKDLSDAARKLGVKTAKVLGIEVPTVTALRADEVIE
jgi:ABC-type uncharacterized transport system substrate-binding protein